MITKEDLARVDSGVYGGEDIVQVVSGQLAAVWRAGIGRGGASFRHTAQSQAPPAAVCAALRENPCTHFREDIQLPAVSL